jgi:hypothetical protein
VCWMSSNCPLPAVHPSLLDFYHWGWPERTSSIGSCPWLQAGLRICGMQKEMEGSVKFTQKLTWGWLCAWTKHVASSAQSFPAGSWLPLTLLIPLGLRW